MQTRKVLFPIDDADVMFTVRGLERTEWADLVHQHPSEDPKFRWNHATLAPALLKACVQHPELDDAFAEALAEDVDAGEELVGLCLQLTLPGSLEPAKRRLATDSRLAAEVSAAVKMGISHTQFSQWDVRSQDLALAHLELATQVCPGCGVPEADMHKADAWEGRTKLCLHCEEIDRDRSEIPEGQERYHHVVLVRPDYYSVGS